MDVRDWLGEDNTLGIDIWERKYRNGNETFEEWLWRVSGGNEHIAKLILEKKFLFGGRILSNRGLNKDGQKVTYSNCYVISPPEDSIESIFECASKLARTFSYGGGCGIDISKLAPNGAKVNNTAKSTSGAVSFMDLYSSITGLIGQNGRRGALMISMDCNHPDLENFIEIKNDLDKVTNANISIRFTDDFMNAVVNDEEVELSFTRPETDETIKKTINAREVFKKLSDSNWDMGEPGCLFWDRVCDYNLLSNTKEFEYAGTNPCAEEPLPAGGSCLLGSINLAEFVKNPFTDKAEFDYASFVDTVYHAVVGLNEVLDEGLPLHPLAEQQESVRDWRQIGLGVMGISDMLIKLGVRYGSKESIDICDHIGATMTCVAINSSSDLAKKFGAFPKCNMDEIVSTSFFDKHFGEFKNRFTEYGLRNSQLLTIAPTGTLSTMLGISGGIEPIFANSYTRTTKSLHKKDVTYKVYTPIVQKYMELNNISNEEDLPDIFVTAQTLDYKDRIAMQSVWQSHIDASISSTINLPNSATKEDVFNIYIEAWRAGLKGVTIFRDGCARTAILNTTESKKEKQEDNKPTKLTIPRGTIMHVPDDLMYRKYKLHTGCGKLYFFVGYDDNGVIYDCFTNTDGTGGCTINTQAVSRLLSACIRGGVPVEYIIEQLQKSGTCPSFQYARAKGKKLSKGSSCPSAIGYVLKDILASFAEEALECEEEVEVETAEVKKAPEQPKTVINSGSKKVCPDCGGDLVHDSGCVTCPGCGWSKCG